MTKGEASRRRLLDTAAAEFASYGIAGSRVDRISVDARVSKAQMYAYYSSKEAMFDAVLKDQVAGLLDVVPLTPADLAGYAVRLYDAYLARPQLVRLATWARLECTPQGFLFAETDEQVKVEAIARAQAAGQVSRAIPAADIHPMVISMAMSWSPSGLIYTASSSDPEDAHQRRRSSLATAVRRAFTGEAPAGEPPG